MWVRYSLVFPRENVGVVWKLDLQHLRIFLGRVDVRIRYIRAGRPVAQLSFLALRVLELVGRLEGSTHFGILPEYGT